MQFDPEKFGRAVGEQIKQSLAPLQKQVADLIAQNAALKKELSELPDIQAAISKGIADAVAAIPAPKDGKDCDMEAVSAALQEMVKAIPLPKDGKDGRDGIDGKDGASGTDGIQGEKGIDGTGMAGALIDRDGCLQITLTNGEVKNLGKVEGADGKDGLSFESFTSEYLPETNEISLKATCAGRTQEIRYPAGGIQLGGYWRDGTKSKACEAWVHDGSLWIAKRDTTAKPESKNEDWVLSARRGRDAEPVPKAAPVGTIKVGLGSK